MFEVSGGGSAMELWLTDIAHPGRGTAVQDEIWAELRRERVLDNATINVAVDGGVAILTGEVWSYAQKATAARAAARVAGVHRIADKIVVAPPPDQRHSDSRLARMAHRVLHWNTLVPPGTVRVTVRGGWVRLDGEVEHDYQRVAAEQALEPLVGLEGLENAVTVRPSTVIPRAAALQEALTHALGPEAKHVTIEVSGPAVAVRGRVRSLAAQHEVERIARAIGGGTVSVNGLTIGR